MRIILIQLELTETIAPRLQPFFFKTVLALAGYSTNAGILKKKGWILLYSRKNLRPSSVKIAAILEFL